MTTACLPVVFLVSPVIDEVGDKEGGNHREEGGANAPQGVRHLRKGSTGWPVPHFSTYIIKHNFYLYDFLPIEMRDHPSPEGSCEGFLLVGREVVPWIYLCNIM